MSMRALKATQQRLNHDEHDGKTQAHNFTLINSNKSRVRVFQKKMKGMACKCRSLLVNVITNFKQKHTSGVPHTVIR